MESTIREAKEMVGQIKQANLLGNDLNEALKEPLEIIKELIKLEPLNYDAYYLKAQIMKLLGNDHVAISILKKCYNFQPTNTLLLEEIESIEEHRRQKAIDGLQHQFERLEKNPKCITAMNCLAYVYTQIENYEEALNWRLRAIDTEPDNWENYYHIAWTYRRLNQMGRCIDSFKKSLQMFNEPIDPENPETDMKPNLNKTIGGMYDEIKEYSTAEAYLRLALELADPSLKRHYYIDLAENLKKQEKYQEALTYFKLHKETDTEKHYPKIDSSIAYCYYKLGDKVSAKAYYQQCVKDNPTDDNSLYCLGVISSEEGDDEFAKMVYQMALQANGNNMSVHYNLGMIAHRESEFRLSVEHFLRVVELDFTNAQAYMMLYHAYDMLTEEEKAEEALVKSIILKEIINKRDEEL